MAKVATADDLRRLLEPVISRAGLDLEAIEMTPAGKRRLLRVVVDQDGGVGLDDIARVSRLVSAALDAAEPLGAQPYVLEVTSPGVERALTEPRHWRRATGRLVQTRSEGRLLTGRVLAVGSDGVEFDVSGQRRVLAWDALAPGRVQVEFNRREVPDPSNDQAEEG